MTITVFRHEYKENLRKTGHGPRSDGPSGGGEGVAFIRHKSKSKELVWNIKLGLGLVRQGPPSTS